MQSSPAELIIRINYQSRRKRRSGLAIAQGPRRLQYRSLYLTNAMLGQFTPRERYRSPDHRFVWLRITCKELEAHPRRIMNCYGNVILMILGMERESERTKRQARAAVLLCIPPDGLAFIYQSGANTGDEYEFILLNRGTSAS